MRLLDNTGQVGGGRDSRSFPAGPSQPPQGSAYKSTKTTERVRLLCRTMGAHFPVGHLSLVFSNQCFLEKPKVESLSSSESKGRRELKRTLIQGAPLSGREGQTSLLRAPPAMSIKAGTRTCATEESDPSAPHQSEKKSQSPRWAQRLLGQLLAMYRSVWVPLARGDEGMWWHSVFLSGSSDRGPIWTPWVTANRSARAAAFP